jgi:uncharacterized protein (TIGR02391 family)
MRTKLANKAIDADAGGLPRASRSARVIANPLDSDKYLCMSIHSLVPDPEALLALEPEELAGVLMEHLNALPPQEQQQLNRYNFGLSHTVREYPPSHHESITRALMEAWGWLEREGLLAPKPGSQGEWIFITRRGTQLRTRDDVLAYRHANLLPRHQLHPRIAQKVWASFLRGDYDTAVFQAFKEVEVRVRQAGKFPDTEIGVNLMRKAFQPESGILADGSAPKSEQQALSDLFAGAIGSYKNPHSHRSVTIEAGEAVEMIVLASHLLGIVDKRASTA